MELEKEERKTSLKKILLNINALKSARKMSWDDVCSAAHIRMASWMTGFSKSMPKDSDLEKIAKVFGVTVDDLKYGNFYDSVLKSVASEEGEKAIAIFG